jgi:hypothetical protein
VGGRDRIYADLQKTDEERRVKLSTVGTRRDLLEQGIELREGSTLHLYSDDLDELGRRDDLVFDGVAHFDEDGQIWTAIVDWDSVPHDSELKSEQDEG